MSWCVFSTSACWCCSATHLRRPASRGRHSAASVSETRSVPRWKIIWPQQRVTLSSDTEMSGSAVRHRYSSLAKSSVQKVQVAASHHSDQLKLQTPLMADQRQLTNVYSVSNLVTGSKLVRYLVKLVQWQKMVYDRTSIVRHHCTTEFYFHL